MTIHIMLSVWLLILLRGMLLAAEALKSSLILCYYEGRGVQE